MAVYVPQIIDNLTSTSTQDGLSANQGRVLKNEHGNLNELYTQNKSSLVAAINEVRSGRRFRRNKRRRNLAQNPWGFCAFVWEGHLWTKKKQ